MTLETKHSNRRRQKDKNRSTGQPRQSLPDLPLEIKQKIVYWLHLLHLDYCQYGDDDSSGIFLDDDDDSSSEDDSDLEHQSAGTTESWTFQSDVKYINPILALSLVDRSFYALCRPYIWRDIDFDEFSVRRLKYFRELIITRQSEFVRSILWRASTSELEEYMEGGWADRLEPDWNPKLRENELLKILESCTKLSKIDLDLFCPEREEPEDVRGYDRPTWRFAEPVSKLTHLTSISLSATSERPFDEMFLVRLIRDLDLIESFKCCWIKASGPIVAPSSESTTTCNSPLAFRLASLSSLKSLELDSTECFDWTWRLIEWKGNLQEVCLSSCLRASHEEINQFRKKFHLAEMPKSTFGFHHAFLNEILSSLLYADHGRD